MNDKLFTSLFEITTFFNRSRQDIVLLERAGVSLDAALLPLIVRIGRYGSISIGELADQVGRNYSTISRQVDKLIGLGLASSVAKPADNRVRLVSLSQDGETIVGQLAQARSALMGEVLQEWDKKQLAALSTSLARLASTIRHYTAQ